MWERGVVETDIGVGQTRPNRRSHCRRLASPLDSSRAPNVWIMACAAFLPSLLGWRRLAASASVLVFLVSRRCSWCFPPPA